MVRKLTLITLAGLALAASSVHAAPKCTVQVGGGLTVPTGDFGDGAKSGFHVLAGFDYHLTDLIAVGLDGAWNSNQHQDVGITEESPPGSGIFITLDEDKFTILDFGAHAKLTFPAADSPIHPYAAVGLGMYNVKERYTYTVDDGVTVATFTEKDDEADGFFEQIGSRFGGRVGIGAAYQVSERMAIDVGGDFHYVSLDKDKTGISSFQFASIHAGLQFGVGGP